MTLSWQREVRAALAPHGLTHVQFVLLASAWWLGEHGTSPTQTQLALHAETDAMMTSQVVRRLELEKLLARRPDPGDSRARLVTITKTGRALLARALPDVEAVDQRYFAPLGRHSKAFTAGLKALAADRRELG